MTAGTSQRFGFALTWSLLCLSDNPYRDFILEIIFAENLVEHDLDAVAGGCGRIKKDE
jgi:hypothetical protein